MDPKPDHGRPRLELRHLRYFLAVAEELNFGRAAERLGIAQPGLSQQVRALEDIIGTPLLDRTRRAVRLTLAGELLAGEARATLARAEAAMLAARRAGRGEVGRLAIGYVASAAYTGVLTSMLGAFREASPEVELGITEMAMQEQLAAMAADRLDVAFIRPPVSLPPGVTSFPVLQEPVAIALPASHPLAAREAVPLEELSAETFITPHHGAGVSFHRHTMAACQLAGFQPRLGPQGRDFMTIASMAAVGLGVALVPRSVGCIQLPGVAYRPLAGPGIMAELAVAHRRSEPSPAARRFIRHARGYRLRGT
ncbi:transcriptional regulator, LysR family [Roseomonas rosea]|uniref:Transcriptional regulator, LysR family n=1 Tax=Muricoccus roseus TaxID=198092 RepID=A0A1M6EQL2_9PROT|nr:LysR family transcriptional regulator [Roseomonas rosea]SHI87726.1 transcriptional regulator, LysR family [Roseomonas rosea]